MAENDRSEFALVAGNTNNSFKRIHTPENAVLSDDESVDRLRTASCTEKLSFAEGIRAHFLTDHPCTH